MLSAVLARRGVQRVVATDQGTACAGLARENLQRLGLTSRVELQQQDLFPEGKGPAGGVQPAPGLPALASFAH